MLCPDCGMQLLDEEAVCPSCGRAVDRSQEDATVIIGGYQDESASRDDTRRLGSDDPTMAKDAPSRASHVMPSEQNIVEMNPGEVIHFPAGEEAVGEVRAEVLDEVSEEPPVEVEGATALLGSEFPTSEMPAHDGGPGADPDKNLLMDIDPLASSGALDALGSLYDTGGMQFPVEGMEDGSRRRVGKELSSVPSRDLPFGKRHRKAIIAAVIIVVAAIIAAGIYLVGFFGPLHAVSDDELRGTLVADDGFMAGRASSMYVDEDAYSIAGLKVDERTADAEGLTIKATVQLRNQFFDETDHVTVVYPDRHDASEYELSIDAHDVTAIRGVSRDADYGISGANPTFNQSAQTCVIEERRGESSNNRWWYSETGEIRLAYKFSSDAWTRTEADTSSLTSSFQHIIGPYGVSDTRFSSFEIRSVDNETGDFSGTFSWVKDGSGWFGSSTMDGRFTGHVSKDGAVEVTAASTSGAIAFTGSFGEGETLEISGTVYLDTAMSTLGLSDAPTATFDDVTLVKGAAMEPVEPAGSHDEAGSADNGGDEGYPDTSGVPGEPGGGPHQGGGFWNMLGF